MFFTAHVTNNPTIYKVQTHSSRHILGFIAIKQTNKQKMALDIKLN